MCNNFRNVSYLVKLKISRTYYKTLVGLRGRTDLRKGDGRCRAPSALLTPLFRPKVAAESNETVGRMYRLSGDDCTSYFCSFNEVMSHRTS